MLSENAKELFDLLASIPQENPRISGWGGSYRMTYDEGVGLPDTRIDDFRATENLFKADITPAWHLPLPTQD